MRRWLIGLLSLTVLLGGCEGHSANGTAGDGGAPDVSQQSQFCPPCVTDADCGGATCAQFQGDSFCAPACGAGGVCPADRTCRSASSSAGLQVTVCEPTDAICGTDDTTPVGDGGAGETCGTLVGPDVTAGCASCPGTASCQANGCYGGWWCDTASSLCRAAPSGCGSSGWDGGPPAAPPGWDAGVGGVVTASGGTLSRLAFAVVGDTRPPNPDDIAGYPTDIITTIYQHLALASPPPPFAVATGDYMFASQYGGQAGPQLDLYVAARNQFPNPVFPALGNHECTGATASNCGEVSVDGVTDNYQQFMTKLLGPIGQPQPYYVINLAAIDGSWTAKLVFVAANAWSDAQGAWLDQALTPATTYTFVIRHEPTSANTAPGVTPSQQIIDAHPYTLLIVGHTHTYARRGTNQVIIGNGGAPLSGSGNYGWGLVQQRPDGAVQVDMLDYQTGLPDLGFRFTVNPDGSAAP